MSLFSLLKLTDQQLLWSAHIGQCSIFTNQNSWLLQWPVNFFPMKIIQRSSTHMKNKWFGCVAQGCSTVHIVLWYLMSMYMYLEVGTTHFYHLALFNLVLGLTSIFYWNPRSSNDEWHIWWHDPIWSCHHPRGQQVHI